MEGSTHDFHTLPLPLRYFPVSRRPFEFTPGLKKLDLHKLSDPTQHIFQLDQQWFDYQEQKKRVLTNHYEEYVREQRLPKKTRLEVCRFLIQRLSHEYPAYFQVQSENGLSIVRNSLTNEQVQCDAQFELIAPSAFKERESLLDVISRQLQEDVCIVQFDQQTDYNAYLHLCFPNHWSAAEKIGVGFLQSHLPVPDMGKINRHADRLMRNMLHSEPMERFTWGITSNTLLDKHPKYQRPVTPGSSLEDYFLRIERQVLVGFQTCDALLFLIRTYHLPLVQLDKEECQRLAFSLSSMTRQTSEYKGLLSHRDRLIELLGASSA